MRDIILLIVFTVLALLSFRRYYIAPLLWAWLSLMNPHRLTYGFAYSMPFAQISAVILVIVFFAQKDKPSFPRSTPAILMVTFYLWGCVTSLLSFNTASEVYDAWSKVSKIQIMLFFTLVMLSGRKQIELLVWVITISIGFFGIKGGLFTIAHAGRAMVMGPAGSFIEGTNHIALAMVMVVPLMYYLSTIVGSKWIRRGLYCAMLLTTLSVLGTTSRGALLAVAAMGVLLALKSKNKFTSIGVVVVVALCASMFMSEQWNDKMGTIAGHEDASAQSRLYTWMMIWNLAMHHPIAGGGFEITANPLTWQVYAVTDYAKAYSPHSIYFQALAEHGFVGLFLYLAIGISTWKLCNSVIKRSSNMEDEWVGRLAKFIQAALLGFAVGGAFVNLVNFDLPYYFVALAILLDRELLDSNKPLQARMF